VSSIPGCRIGWKEAVPSADVESCPDFRTKLSFLHIPNLNPKYSENAILKKLGFREGGNFFDSLQPH